MAIPAAQYLRMSTEHQQYSLANQEAAIGQYAVAHGFEVIKTYSDAAKSGLVLKNRAGLRELLKDTVDGSVGYKAILVYDVSRWGRFQDIDESAFYEYLCKSSGIPVHYCAEPFTNDLGLQNLILKALKRTMAGEFSRELSTKVSIGKIRIAKLGFRQGGSPGYGLRRLLVSADGEPKEMLKAREKKSIQTDRVLLVPGPSEEVERVREIYRLCIFENQTPVTIAREFNKRGYKSNGGLPWHRGQVSAILKNPKYAGFNLYGKWSRRLNNPPVPVPISEWTVIPNAFVPVVDHRTFLQAQQALASNTVSKTNDQILQDLRSLLNSQGKLSTDILKNSRATPSANTFRNRFGSLAAAYRHIGFETKSDAASTTRIRIYSLRQKLIFQIKSIFAGEVSTIEAPRSFRLMFRIHDRRTVSVIIARSIKPCKGWKRWIVQPVPDEWMNITLLATLDPINHDFSGMFMFPCLDRHALFTLKEEEPWFRNGVPLTNLQDFLEVIGQVADSASEVA